LAFITCNKHPAADFEIKRGHLFMANELDKFADNYLVGNNVWLTVLQHFFHQKRKQCLWQLVERRFGFDEAVHVAEDGLGARLFQGHQVGRLGQPPLGRKSEERVVGSWW